MLPCIKHVKCSYLNSYSCTWKLLWWSAVLYFWCGHSHFGLLFIALEIQYAIMMQWCQLSRCLNIALIPQPSEALRCCWHGSAGCPWRFLDVSLFLNSVGWHVWWCYVMHTCIFVSESLSGNMLPICANISGSKTAFCCMKPSLLQQLLITELILWCWQMQNKACFFILRTFVSDPK